MEIPEKWINRLYEIREECAWDMSKLPLEDNLRIHMSFAKLYGYIESLELIKNIWKH